MPFKQQTFQQHWPLRAMQVQPETIPWRGPWGGHTRPLRPVLSWEGTEQDRPQPGTLLSKARAWMSENGETGITGT